MHFEMRRILLTMSLATVLTVSAQIRQEITLSDDWSFSHDQQTDVDLTAIAEVELFSVY